MGVADGVYQWREQGIDAGEFSRLLMQTSLQAVEEGQPDVLKGVLHLQPPASSPSSPSPFPITCTTLLSPQSSQLTIKSSNSLCNSFMVVAGGGVLAHLHTASPVVGCTACL